MVLVFPFVGLLEGGLSVPLILEKIPPNYLYGFRTPKTLSSRELWYKANKYAGRELLVAGAILSGGCLALLIWQLLSGMDLRGDTAVLICLALTLVPLSIALLRSFIYLKKL